MWSRIFCTLVYLTEIMSGNVKIKLTKVEQYLFVEIKRVVDRDVLLAYPNLNEDFNTHANARKLQLEVVIRKNDKPISFYSIKLTGA